jgi:tetratricopeptide (TPR) repeat protein
LESGEGEARRNRHLEHFLDLSEEAAPQLQGSEQAVWLERLEIEHDNLRSALAWSSASVEGETWKVERPGSSTVQSFNSGRSTSNDPASGLRLAAAIWRFWEVRGLLKEGRNWLAPLLARDLSEQSMGVRSTALNGAGTLALRQGDYAAARALFEDALVILRALDNQTGIASSLNNLGNVAHYEGDYSAARVFHTQSLAIRRELGDPWGIAASLNNLGNVAHEQGDYSAAQSLYEESIEIKSEIGDRRGIAMSLNNLGDLAYERGDNATARSLHEASLAIKRELGDRWGIAMSLKNLGNVASERGEHEVARALHKESLTISSELGDRRGVAYAFEGLAYAVGALGRPVAAARLMGRTQRMREEIGAPVPRTERSRYETRLAAIRAALADDAAFDAAWREGRAMAPEQAMALALEDGEGSRE